MGRKLCVGLLLVLVFAAPRLGSAESGDGAEPSERAEGAVRSKSDASAQTPARVETRHRLNWQWRELHWADYAGLGAGVATYAAVELAIPVPDDPKRSGPILFDSNVRDALVAQTRDGRNRAAVWSDVNWIAPNLWLWVDTLAVPTLVDSGNYALAWRLSVINLQAYALSGILTRGAHKLVGRGRPDVAPCDVDADYHDQCYRGSTASFPSGHTSGSFTGAGLLCSQHQYLSLYGSAPLDYAACGLALGMATTTGVLRMVADRHYVSDVILGSLVGFGTGYVFPVFTHYLGRSEVEQGAQHSAALRWTVVPGGDTNSFSVNVLGGF